MYEQIQCSNHFYVKKIWKKTIYRLELNKACFQLTVNIICNLFSLYVFRLASVQLEHGDAMQQQQQQYSSHHQQQQTRSQQSHQQTTRTASYTKQV